MKKTFSYSWILISLMISFYTASAQTDSSKNVQFKLGAFYNTHLNYYGRTDSLRSSGFFPLAEVWFNRNFYMNVAPVFVNNASASFEYAGTIATAGYQFISGDKKWFGNLFAVKPFYKNNSQLVQSALKEQTGFSLTSLNKTVNITGGADIKLSDKIDFGFTGGLDHIFRKQFRDNSIVVIDPSVNLFAGMQQFTNSYYKKSSFLLLPPVEQTLSEEVKNFNILSFEFSMAVIFRIEKFQFLFTPAYVIPENLITVQDRPDLSETGKKMFYATIGAKMIL